MAGLVLGDAGKANGKSGRPIDPRKRVPAKGFRLDRALPVDRVASVRRCSAHADPIDGCGDCHARDLWADRTGAELRVGVAFKIYDILAWRRGQIDFLQSALTRAVLFSALPSTMTGKKAA